MVPSWPFYRFVRRVALPLIGLDREALAGRFPLLEQAWERIRGLIPGAEAVDLGGLIDATISRTGGALAARVGGVLADLAVVLFQLFVTLLALFFLLRDADDIMRYIRRVLPLRNYAANG